MKKASATLINLRDNFMGAEENFKQTTITLLGDSIRNMNDLSSLFYRFFTKNNKKPKNNESKKITGTKISENERLAMLIRKAYPSTTGNREKIKN
jgi:hypothetical protein